MGCSLTASLYPLPKTIAHIPKEVASLNTDLAQEQTCAKNRNYPFSYIANGSLSSREPEFSLSAPGQPVGQ